MSSKSVHKNSEKALFAAFRKVLRDLSNDEEKSRRAEIRAGKKPATQNGQKRKAGKGNSKPSGSTSRPIAKSVTEGRVKASGSAKVQPRKGSKTVSVEQAKVTKQLGGGVAKLSPSRLRRKALRQEKIEAAGGYTFRGSSADRAKDELLYLAAEKRALQKEMRKEAETGKVSSVKTAKAKVEHKKPQICKEESLWNLEWQTGSILSKGKKREYTFYSWTVDKVGHPVRVKRDYRKCVSGIPRILQKESWLGGGNAADSKLLPTTGKVVKSAVSAKSRRSKQRALKRAPKGVLGQAEEVPLEEGSAAPVLITVEIPYEDIITGVQRREAGAIEALVRAKVFDLVSFNSLENGSRAKYVLRNHTAS